MCICDELHKREKLLFKENLNNQIDEIVKIADSTIKNGEGKICNLLREKLFVFEYDFLYHYMVINKHTFGKKQLVKIKVFLDKFLKVNNFSNLNDIDIGQVLRELCGVFNR